MHSNREEQLGKSGIELAVKCVALSNCYRLINYSPFAKYYYLKALELVKDTPEDLNFICVLLDKIAHTSCALFDFDTEIECRLKTLELIKQLHGERSFHFGIRLFNLASRFKELGQWESAINFFQPAYEVLNSLGNQEELILNIYRELTDLYVQLGYQHI